jgi:hypothetical protein
LVRDLLNLRLTEKPTVIITADVKTKPGAGVKYNPDTIPAHNGTMIRRNGISL